MFSSATVATSASLCCTSRGVGCAKRLVDDAARNSDERDLAELGADGQHDRDPERPLIGPKEAEQPEEDSAVRHSPGHPTNVVARYRDLARPDARSDVAGPR